jgi:glycosyltransferase involved in cell wall biosynthesis
MPEQKHILFISSWYPTPSDPTLGVFNRYFALAASLYNKVTVLNISSRETQQSTPEIVTGDDKGIYTVQVYYQKVLDSLPVVSQIKKRGRVVSAFEQGYQKVVEARGKVDLMQLNVVMPMGIGVLHLSEKYNIPYVINENWSGYGAEDGNYRGLALKYFTQKIIKGAKAIMPTSTYLRDAMQGHGLEGNYHVVPNVVNVNVFKPLSLQKNTGTKLIHISSLNDREKNVSGLIRAFAQACSQHKELYLDIVGEGVDKQKYIALVNELDIENNVKFVGRLFSEDLVKSINAADALIMFSNFETFCLVIIEAFACGKPVITSNAGAIKTYMQPFLGYLVDKGDEQKLAESILAFAKKEKVFDHEKIRQFAVENYSYEKVGSIMDRIYRDALNK